MWNKINNIIKTSMKAKDAETLSFARNLKTKINEHLVAEKLPRDKAADDVVESIATAYQKSLKKALVDLKKGDSDNARELVETYGREIEFCSQFVPDTGASRDVVRNLVVLAVEELGTSNFGRVMGHVMKNNKGLDGMLVKEVATEVINGS